MERLLAPVEWKASTDGSLDGYASTFGNVDLGGDVVMPGAFTESIARIKAEGIPLLADHVASTSNVLGTIFDAAEDEKGLRIRARFSSVQSVQEVRTKLLEGHLGKLSIGYRVKEEDYSEINGQPVRLLKAIDVMETSVVVFAMNPKAEVVALKQTGTADRLDFALRLAGLELWLSDPNTRLRTPRIGNDSAW